MPVVLYDARSRGSEAYLALAREFLERDGRKTALAAGAGGRDADQGAATHDA
jgi:hypothetical protein